MSTWQEVLERGRRVARILRNKRRSTARYENCSGPAVDGWKLYDFSVTRDDTEYSGGSDYKDVWVNNRLILGHDGVIYMFSLVNTENGRRESGGFRVTTDRLPSVRPIRPEAQHPTPYETLQENDVMRLLNRLAGKENSSPEPEAPDTKRDEVFSKDPVKPLPVQAPVHRPAETVHAAASHQAAKETEREASSRTFLVLTTIAPFAFLALLVLIFVLLGARPN